jgi:hypothetical protein
MQLNLTSIKLIMHNIQQYINIRISKTTKKITIVRKHVGNIDLDAIVCLFPYIPNQSGKHFHYQLLRHTIFKFTNI